MVANAIVPVTLNEDEQRKISAVKSLANIVYALRYDVFKENLDFGKIPGTGDKPTLLLPGMEKLMRALRLRAEYHAVSIIEDYKDGVFAYRYECRLIEYETGLCIATAIGSCNSKESKYRWREQKRTCPYCGKDTIYRSKFAPKNNLSAQPGWYCYSKPGGCGKEFAFDDTAITSQPIGRIENPDIYDQTNTIDKIAQKRALSSAIKSAANVSELFTVDLEDFPTYRVDLPDDVIEGEIVEPTVQPVPEKPATNGNGTHTLDWTTIFTELKPLFNGNTEDARKAIEVLRETGYIAPDANEAMIIKVVKESLQKPAEPPQADVDLDAHIAAKSEDKPVEAPKFGIPKISVPAECLSVGDIIALDALTGNVPKSKQWEIMQVNETVSQDGKPVIPMQLRNLETNEPKAYYPTNGGHVLETVVGGGKLIAANENPALVKKNGSRYVWVRESDNAAEAQS